MSGDVYFVGQKCSRTRGGWRMEGMKVNPHVLDHHGETGVVSQAKMGEKDGEK